MYEYRCKFSEKSVNDKINKILGEAKVAYITEKL